MLIYTLESASGRAVGRLMIHLAEAGFCLANIEMLCRSLYAISE